MFHAYTNIIKLSNRVANHYGKLQGGTLSDYWVSRCHQPTPSMSDYSLQSDRRSQVFQLGSQV